MKNISFDNPYLLLILIPLLILILVPIFIAIRKENNSKSVMASLILHIVIALCISLALAGMIYTSVMTRTQVVVVADVSYSANRNLDEVDDYIRQLEDKLPRNSQMSVMVFGREFKVLTEMGEDLVSVKEHGFKPTQIDATNISDAINHAVTLFDENVIKRIVVITDGKETRANAAGDLAAAVDNAYASDIYIDAIYLDDNLGEDVKEVQISDVTYSPSIYKNHPSTATILVQSTFDTENAIIDFFVDSVRSKTLPVVLHKGYNVINFELPYGSAGSFDYRFTIRADADTATANSVYDFTQTVTNNMHVLLVSWDEADKEKLEKLYDEETVIDAYIQQSTVPCTVEELCVYDEIVLSNFDVREIQNYTSFIESIDRVVSRFGKSLVTMGDLKIQSKSAPIFQSFEDMLPVKFGNSDMDPKLYAIVLDASRSMQNFSRLRIAKQAAIQLMNLLSDNDYVMVVVFWGDLAVLQAPTKASNREDVAKLISDWDPRQGTMLGTALDKAGDTLKDMPFSEKQVMLISDGMSYALEKDDPVDVVTRLRSDYGIVTSVIHPAGVKGQETSDSSNGDPTTLKKIANAGGGKYFAILREEDMEEVMFQEIQEDITKSVMEGDFKVTIKNRSEDVVDGITSLPNVQGYAYAKAKASANTVLTVPFVKPSGTPVEVPLFAYWEYGNGRVSSFTSTFSGKWSGQWNSDEAMKFFANVAELSVPATRVGTPYNVNVTFDGSYSEIEIVPVTLNPKATTDVTITTPDGTQITERLIFDSTRYFYSFETPKIGNYRIDITYNHTYDDEPITSEAYFNISYSPEYNMFEVFDPSDLHAAIRNRGTVCEGTIPSLVNDDKEVATYTIRFVAPLMAVAAVLYIVDIIIRKLKISDIKSFFGIKPKRGVGK